MPYGYKTDPELDRSTNRVMLVGVVLLVAMAAAFPLYLSYEPSAREDARASHLASLAEEGEGIWELSCASCHGAAGEGVSAPALNSEQFLQSASDKQIELLVSVGIPGTAMSAYSQDFAGPMTSEQIKAVTTFIRAWEEGAPDVPNLQNPLARADLDGNEIYNVACASCHGDDLAGVGEFPALGPGSDAEEESDDRLVLRINNGKDEMPAFAGTLDDAQIDLIVEYLRESQRG